MAPPGQILIAHSDPLARAYMRGLAESQLQLAGTVEADSFDTLLAKLREKPGIELVIVDINLPGLSWQVGLRYLAAQHHGVRVAVLFSSLDGDDLESLATSGIAALVPKHLPEASLVEIFRRTLAGEGFDPSTATNTTPPERRSGAQVTYLVHGLTTRQRDVLRLLSLGRSNREIAQMLGIAEATVKVHVNAAFRILGVHNRVSATAAFREYSEARLAHAR